MKDEKDSPDYPVRPLRFANASIARRMVNFFRKEDAGLALVESAIAIAQSYILNHVVLAE